MLYRELPRLLALRTLHESQTGAHRTPQQVKELVLAATDDLERAEKAEAEYILSELRQGRNPNLDDW